MRNEKRKTWFLVGCLLLLMIGMTVLFSGCASQKSTGQPQVEAQSDKPSKLGDLYLVGATQGGSGVFDLMGTGFGKAITQKIPGSRITFVPGEGIPNVKTVNDGKAELGLMHSTTAAAATKGEEPYKEVLDKVRGLASLYDAKYLFVVLKDYPLNSLEELAVKKPLVRIAVGDPGSIIEMVSRKTLAKFGVTYQDIESWGGKVFYKSMGDAADMMIDGLIDALSITGTVPQSAIQEISTSKELKLLALPKKALDETSSQFGFSPSVIPKDVYNFVKEDVPTFAFRTILGTHAGVSDDDVYKMTKALVESLNDIHGIHSNLQGLTPEIMATGTGAPLHPGSEKYYREIGAIK